MDPLAQFSPNLLRDFLEGEWRDLSSTLPSPSTFNSAETSRYTPLGATLPDDDGILPYHKGKKRVLEPTDDFPGIPEPGGNHCVSETSALDAPTTPELENALQLDLALIDAFELPFIEPNSSK